MFFVMMNHKNSMKSCFSCCFHFPEEEGGLVVDAGIVLRLNGRRKSPENSGCE